MKKILLFVILFTGNQLYAQSFAYGDHWYDNPLGFKPIELHTRNGFLIPALAVGLCVWLTQKDTTLDRRISFYNETGWSHGYKYPHTNLIQNNSGIEIRLRKWMSIGIDLDAYFPYDDFNSTTGVGIRSFARFYPVNQKQWRLFFDSGAGLMYFADFFPKPTDRDARLGTHWNGTTRYGIGSEIDFSQRIAIIIAIRHTHVSNGNSKGAERNPSHDSNGFFVGMTYRP
ncbi:acyloxyacyl hydrolase [bacterium]|nr:acyloxyacyl hydrolase [bacterium]